MLSQTAQKQNFVLSTNSYHDDLIKGQEIARGEIGDQLIFDGPTIRIPNDFKLFLSSYRNKEQLCQMLKEVWTSPEAASPIIEMFNCNFGC